MSESQESCRFIFDSDQPLTALREKLFKALKQSRFRLVSADKNQGTLPYFHLVKNTFGLWGPRGVHLGVIVILLGGLISFLKADIRDVELREGQELFLPQEKAALKLEKFAIIPYAGSENVEQYKSHFLVKWEDKKRRYQDLGVNHPMKLGSTKIFQMRYRVEVPRIELTIFKEGALVSGLLLNQGEASTVATVPFVIRYEDVVPDFKMGPVGEVFSTGTFFRNPAVKLFLKDKLSADSQEESRWAFQDFLPGHEEKGKIWDFRITKIYKSFYSGLRLSYDPGKPVVYLGYLLVVISVFLSSFAIPRTISVSMQELDGKGRIVFEGLSKRDPLGLEDEMKCLIKWIKKA